MRDINEATKKRRDMRPVNKKRVCAWEGEVDKKKRREKAKEE